MATQCCGQQTYGSAHQPKQDKRTQLIDDIKILIENIDNEERGRPKGSRGRAAGGGGAAGNVQDPDLERQCREYRKRRQCSPPIITSIASHEFRRTSDFARMQYENTSQVTYVDATRPAGAVAAVELDPMPPAPWELPRTPSQELRAGTLYQSCECRRRNGLQHDCPRWECGGRAECVAVNPGPCCVPSKARKPVRGDRRDMTRARQCAEVDVNRQTQEVGRQEKGKKEEKGAGVSHQLGLVVPIFVHVGGQAQQQGGPNGGQSPNVGQQSQNMTYSCQPHGNSPKEGAEKITEMSGPYGWPAGGQQPGQMPQGGPITLCRPAGGQAPPNHPHQPQFGAGPPQSPRGPVTLQGPGVTCVCRPARTPHSRPQPQVGGGGYVDLYEVVMIGQPNPRQ